MKTFEFKDFSTPRILCELKKSNQALDYQEGAAEFAKQNSNCLQVPSNLFKLVNKIKSEFAEFCLIISRFSLASSLEVLEHFEREL